MKFARQGGKPCMRQASRAAAAQACPARAAEARLDIGLRRRQLSQGSRRRAAGLAGILLEADVHAPGRSLAAALAPAAALPLHVHSISRCHERLRTRLGAQAANESFALMAGDGPGSLLATGAIQVLLGFRPLAIVEADLHAGLPLALPGQLERGGLPGGARGAAGRRGQLAQRRFRRASAAHGVVLPARLWRIVKADLDASGLGLQAPAAAGPGLRIARAGAAGHLARAPGGTQAEPPHAAVVSQLPQLRRRGEDLVIRPAVVQACFRVWLPRREVHACRHGPLDQARHHTIVAAASTGPGWASR